MSVRPPSILIALRRTGLILAAALVGGMTAAAGAATVPAATTPGSATPAATTPPPATPVADAPDADLAADAVVVPQAPTRARSYAARLVVPVIVRRAPDPRSGRVARLQPYGSWNGGPVVLGIAEVREVDGERWLRVQLPTRPNGATGWLLQDRVEVSMLRYRVEINRRARRLTLLRDGKRVATTRVVIGASATPTPAGRFAVLEVVRQPRGGVLGPWALHLTAHSNVLDNYGGGPGRVAMHGRSGALLSDPLGTARSHGCIRMPNAVIERLHRVAVEGTPVVIR